jgi:hypothetical protein
LVQFHTILLFKSYFKLGRRKAAADSNKDCEWRGGVRQSRICAFLTLGDLRPVENRFFTLRLRSSFKASTFGIAFEL